MSNTLEVIQKRSVVQRFSDLLGESKAEGFVTNLLEVVRSNARLSKANPQTVLHAAATAASLDLPLTPGLGFAWIVPYNNRRAGEIQAQFQMGYKGYIQLAHRTGQYRAINAAPVYGNQFISFQTFPTRQLRGNFDLPPEGSPVGYAAYFVLVNGFAHTEYWTAEQMDQHGLKYSQSYRDSKSVWASDYDKMACKTVLKTALHKFGPLDQRIALAYQADSSIQTEEGQYEYPDNETQSINFQEIDENKEKARFLKALDQASTLERLDELKPYADKYDAEQTFHDKYLTLENQLQNANQ